MRVTRKDIAKYAGVSEQTVSYVLNGSRKFSQEIITKVQNAVSVLNYKPDMIAKSMVKKSTSSVAVLVRNMENPIFPAIFHGFQKRALEFGYSVYLSDLEGYNDISSTIAELISRRIDGLYLSLVYEDGLKDIVNTFLNADIKVVLGNKYPNMFDNVPCVITDFKTGIENALKYLAEMGHTDIAYLSGLDIKNNCDNRCSSFMESYKEIFKKEALVIENDSPFTTNIEDGIALTKKLLKLNKKVTAIITTNDLMAYGVIDALNEQGYRVPDDISVIGIDNIMYSKYVNPSLTTISYDYAKIGSRAFDKLKAMIDGNTNIEDEIIETEIIKRNSVKKITINFQKSIDKV